jgi:hypothetical protein
MQYDKVTYTVPVTSGGVTTNNYPTGGFAPKDSPCKISELVAKPANFANNVTVTVSIVDGETGIPIYTSAALSRGTAYPISLSYVIVPGDYFQVITSGDIGATLNTVMIRASLER